MDSGGGFAFQSYTLASSCFDVFSRMKREGKLCDITIKLGNYKTSAHRVVLAAAIPYFRNAFENSQAVSDLMEIKMTDVNEIALESLVDFAYNCRVEISDPNVKAILTASCALDVAEVRDICCHYLDQRLNPDNVLATREFVENLGSCSSLVKRTETYVCDNFDSVCETEAFLRVPYSFLMELLARDDLGTSGEEQVFQAVMRWVKASPDERVDKLVLLLSRVRLEHVSFEYLKDHVWKEELIKRSISYKKLRDKAGGQGNTMRRRRPEIKNDLSGIYAVRKSFLVLRLDFENGAWTTVSNTPLRPFGALTADANTLQYIDSSVSRSYTLLNTDWTDGVKYITGAYMGAAVLRDNVYVAGGIGGHQVECCNFKNLSYCLKSPMITPRSGLALVTLGDYLYAIGGQSGDDILESVERYDPEKDTWTELSPMCSKRYLMGCTTMGGKIYVCGGSSQDSSDDPGVVSSAEVYDPLADKWTPIQSLKVARYDFSLVAYRGKLCAIGGTGEHKTDVDRVEIYDPETDKWELGPLVDSSRLRAVAIHPMNPACE